MDKICIVLILCVGISIAQTVEGVNDPTTFCGDKLVKFMTFCKRFFTPEHRWKRQIITECCKSKCTAEHLLTNYCAKFDILEVVKYINEENERRQEAEARRTRSILLPKIAPTSLMM